MRTSHPYFPRNAFYWMGGGGGSQPAPVVQQIQSAPVPTPAPPVSQSARDVIAAEKDLSQQNLLKKSVKKTIYAGDTHTQAGGPGSTTTGPSTFRKT